MGCGLSHRRPFTQFLRFPLKQHRYTLPVNLQFSSDFTAANLPYPCDVIGRQQYAAIGYHVNLNKAAVETLKESFSSLKPPSSQRFLSGSESSHNTVYYSHKTLFFPASQRLMLLLLIRFCCNINKIQEPKKLLAVFFHHPLSGSLYLIFVHQHVSPLLKLIKSRATYRHQHKADSLFVFA